VVSVQFADDYDQAHALLKAEFPQALLLSAENHNGLTDWMHALETYIAEGGIRPDIPLDMRGTLFQIKIWQFLTTLGPDETLTYSQLAERIGHIKAVRAAASACAANRIGVLIPCHKVLRTDGGLGGFRWGLARKKSLLKLEV